MVKRYKLLLRVKIFGTKRAHNNRGPHGSTSHYHVFSIQCDMKYSGHHGSVKVSEIVSVSLFEVHILKMLQSYFGKYFIERPILENMTVLQFLPRR